MKPFIHIAAVLLAVLAFASVPASAAQRSTQSSVPQVSVIVTFKQRANLKGIGGKRADRRRATVLALLQAQRAQDKALARLQKHQGDGKIASFRSLWVTNAIAITASQSVIDELAALPEVESVVPDVVLQAPARQKNDISGNHCRRQCA